MSAPWVVVALALAVGLPLESALRGGRGVTLPERVGRALALGLGALGAVSMLADVLHLGVSRVTVGAGAAAVILLSLVVRRRGRASGTHSDGVARVALLPQGAGPRLATVALWALTLLALAMVVHQGLLRPVFQFDAVARWMFKAKVLHFDGTLLGPISTSAEFAFTHQRYPPLVSHVANLPALISGSFDDRLASAIFPWFSVALAGILHGVLSRWVGPLSGAVAAAWFASLPMVWFLVSPPAGAGAASAMADLPLALFGAAAAFAACDQLDSKRGGALEVGLLLGLTSLCKNEGLPLVAAVLLGWMLARPSHWRRVLAAGALAVALNLALWTHVALTLPALDEHYPAQLTWAALSEGWQRLGVVLPALAAHLLALPAWNITWPALLLLMALGAARLLTPRARLLAVAVTVQCAAYVLAYLITAWTSPKGELVAEDQGDPVVLLVALTADRLLLHVFPLALALALWMSRSGEAAEHSLAPAEPSAELAEPMS